MKVIHYLACWTGHGLPIYSHFHSSGLFEKKTFSNNPLKPQFNIVVRLIEVKKGKNDVPNSFLNIFILFIGKQWPNKFST